MMNTSHYTGTHNASSHCFPFSVEGCTVPYSMSSCGPRPCCDGTSHPVPICLSTALLPAGVGPLWLASLPPPKAGRSIISTFRPRLPLSGQLPKPLASPPSFSLWSSFPSFSLYLKSVWWLSSTSKIIIIIFLPHRTLVKKHAGGPDSIGLTQRPWPYEVSSA